jgi:hypothetical protein
LWSTLSLVKEGLSLSLSFINVEPIHIWIKVLLGFSTSSMGGKLQGCLRSSLWYRWDYN